MIEIAGGVWLGLCMFACTVCAVVWVGEKIPRVRRSRKFGNPSQDSNLDISHF